MKKFKTFNLWRKIMIGIIEAIKRGYLALAILGFLVFGVVYMHIRISKLEKHIGYIEQKIEQKAENIEQKVEDLESKLENIESGILDVELRIEDLE